MKGNEFKIAEAFPPGETLREKLEELGMPIKEFALRCGKPEPTIHAVLHGKSAVTTEMALLFEKVLGIPARLWLNLQCQYEEYKARLRNAAELQEEREWAAKFPFDEMVAKGYLNAPQDLTPAGKTEALLSFFGFAKTAVWDKYYRCQILKAEFRLSLSGLPQAHALSAWLRYGENKALAQTDLPAFSVEALKRQIPAMRDLANRGGEAFLPALGKLCRAAGVILVCTPHLSGARARGATRWLKASPLVQVSDCRERYDVFWFTFFHELGHILLHGKREAFLEGLVYGQLKPDKEKAADNFAASCLIPKKTESKLPAFHYSAAALVDFCKAEGVHCAFVAGRLQQIGLLPQPAEKRFIPMVDFTKSAPPSLV